MAVTLIAGHHVLGLSGGTLAGIQPVFRRSGKPVFGLPGEVHLFAGTGDIIAGDGNPKRAVGIVLEAFPGPVREQHPGVPLPLQEETHGDGGLGIRLGRALVIHQCADDVLAGLEPGNEVHRLIVPMGGIPLGRAQGDERTIDIQFVAVVTGHMDHIVRRNGGEVHILSEIVHAIILRPGLGNADPTGVPVV